MPVLDFQILACRVLVNFEDSRIGDALRYLVQGATQHFEIKQEFSYHIHGNGPWLIWEEGDFVQTAKTPAGVVNIVYQRIYKRVIERMVLSGWISIHGAMATINGASFLMIGNKGAGKSTLAMKLLQSGYEVHGDEMVFISNDHGVSLPRAFHLKKGTAELVRDTFDRQASVPEVESGPHKIQAFDPSLAGFDWNIVVRPIDAVVLIEPNHGEKSSLETMSSFEIIRHLANQAFESGETPGHLIREISSLGKSGGQRLRNGDPSSSVKILEQLCAT